MVRVVNWCANLHPSNIKKHKNYTESGEGCRFPTRGGVFIPLGEGGGKILLYAGPIMD